MSQIPRDPNRPVQASQDLKGLTTVNHVADQSPPPFAQPVSIDSGRRPWRPLPQWLMQQAWNQPWLRPFMDNVICWCGQSGNVSDGTGGQVQAKKPALYLYPEEPTDVSVKLDPAIALAIDIPRYNPQTGWQVKAFPNGNLQDLQPELTDMAALKDRYLNASQENSEAFQYLYQADLTGFYPYIYWDGQQTSQPLPETGNSGFLVETSQLASFLATTLSTLGLNETESNDFSDYWVPMLTSLKEATHFKLTFLLTSELNEYLPMQITPAPTSLLRVMMLVEVNPSDAVMAQTQPQELPGFERHGFVAVEWGGALVSSPNYKHQQAVRELVNSGH